MESGNSFRRFIGTDDSFRLQLDLLGNGEVLNFLVIPNERDYIVTVDGIHLCTIKHDCDNCWALTDGHINDEAAYKIGEAIEAHYGR